MNKFINTKYKHSLNFQKKNPRTYKFYTTFSMSDQENQSIENNAQPTDGKHTPITPNKNTDTNHEELIEDSITNVDQSNDSIDGTNITPGTNEDSEEECRQETDLQVRGSNEIVYNDDKTKPEDDESQVDQHTLEDDDNTINSNTTSVYNNKNIDKNVLPPFHRYQMMILLDQNDPFKITDETEDDVIKSPAQRIREVLISFATRFVPDYAQ